MDDLETFNYPLSAQAVRAPETAAQTHAIMRAKSGFDIQQLASEYRALRASVLRLWTDTYQFEASALDDVMRFNEANVPDYPLQWTRRFNRMDR